MTDNTILTPVEDLREGDLVDLEGDRYADPDHDDPSLQSDYAEVWGEPMEDWHKDNQLDPSDTTIVNFNWPGHVGFPRGWKVRKLNVDDVKQTDGLPDHAEYHGD